MSSEIPKQVRQRARYDEGDVSQLAIIVHQDATLEEAAAICAGRFPLAAPANWPDLHAMAKRAGFVLVPGARRAQTTKAPQPP